MNDVKITDLRERIIKGWALSLERLIEAKKKNNGKFVISKDGEIIEVEASEMSKYQL